MRRQDGRLFLLDFGSVKQVTSAKVSSASTAIYTPGFAAPEQTTRGQVFPSTDIYALGVTILTLLTGKEATELFDPQINQWRWRQEVKISPHLSGILDKMLMPAINERFSSATEVLSALIPSITIPDQPQPSNLPFKGLMVKKFSFGELLLRGAVTDFEGALIVIAVGLLVETPIIRLAISLVISVFSELSSRPFSLNHCCIWFRAFLRLSLSLAVTMKSSAYLTTPSFGLVYFIKNSNPCNPILASKGDITPRCLSQMFSCHDWSE